jgi:hypothetical protein
MALYDELAPEERLKYKQKAYDKYANVAPMQKESQGIQRQQIEREGQRGVGTGLREGGFAGGQAIGKSMDQTALELAKKVGEQQKETDATNLQGAQMKEDLVGQRESDALSKFKRDTDKMEETLTRAITERAFDLGMTSKELAFHTNAKVADIGFDKLKEDYDKGVTSKQELNNVQMGLERESKKLENEAKELMNRLRWETELAAKNREFGRVKELTKQLIEKQKDTIKSKARASNIAAIVSGTVKTGASMVLGNNDASSALGTGASAASGLLI